MPSLFRLGPYIIFFWTGENGEPVHVHIAVKRPTAEATKIWLPAPADASWPITRAIFLLGIYAISCSLFHLTMR